MLFHLITPVALATLALAAPEMEKRQTTTSFDPAEVSSLASLIGISTIPTDPAKISSLMSEVSSLEAILPPASILSVLETAVPASVISELADPASASVFASEFEVGSYPAWYSSLPSDVKNFFSTYSPTLATNNEAATTSATSSNEGTNSAGKITGPAATPTSTAAANSEHSLSVTQISTGTATAGATRETAGLAVGALGVAGVLGLAMGL